MLSKIGDWTSDQLVRFILSVIHSMPLPKSVQASEIHASDRLVVERELELSPEAITYLKKKLGL